MMYSLVCTLPSSKTMQSRKNEFAGLGFLSGNWASPYKCVDEVRIAKVR